MKNLFALLLLATACTMFSAPNYGERFSPPRSYEYMWKEMEQCSGLRGDYHKLEWFRTEDGALGDKVVGRWYSPHSIILTDFAVSYDATVIIQHEMLHDLRQSGGHPAVFDTCHVR